MKNEIPGDGKKFKVIMNRQKQYAIWPAERENEAGWSTVGKRGSKSECIKYIEEVWTDMRPLDLRKLMGK